MTKLITLDDLSLSVMSDAGHSGLLLPTDPAARKRIPIGTGFFDYFTASIIEVAKVSWQGNQQHNPGEPLHWSRDKSTDHFDTLMRHLAERGGFDVDGQRHTAKALWRLHAILQLEMEAAGAPVARGAKIE
jgi:hypothetical protein